MQIRFSQRFLKLYQKLSANLQKQVDSKLRFLNENFFHPSLRTKKMKGFENRWEFRVSRRYRMTAVKEGNELILTTVGPHDEALR